MSVLRLGGVGYLNARPLTWALDRVPGRWQVRYDLPAACAGLLASGDIDLGLVSSIEYLNSPRYRIVPGVGIGSFGPVLSVAMYARRPVDEIRSIALDTSSRTSVALLRILCHRRFRIEPSFVMRGPDLEAMMKGQDAALLIGDPAFEADHQALGLTKYDLGAEWTEMTGLPFVYAAWTGPEGPVTAEAVAALQSAQAEGVEAIDRIASEYAGSDPARAVRAARYLRDTIRYGLGDAEAAGLQLFLDLAADLGLAPGRRQLHYF